MGYEREPPRARRLTPLESELRLEEPQPSRRRRLVPRRRSRRPARTLRGAILVAASRVGVGIALGAVAAWLVARWLDRPLPVGFYLVGAGILVVGLLGPQRAAETEPDGGDPDSRLARAFTWVAVGFALVGIGALLELA